MTEQVQAQTQVSSSDVPKSLQSMTKEERARRFAELRAKLGRSKLAVQGEPGIHYLWAPVGDDQEMTRLDYLGYTVTREPNAKDVLAGKVEPKIKAAGLRQDGTYKQGDVILTQCPQELYELIMLELEQRQEAMSSGTTNDFRSSAEQRGVPLIEVSSRPTSVRRQ